MNNLIEKVRSILEQFAREEMGNRLSQFALIALKEMVINEIKDYKVEEDKGNKKVKE